MKKIIFCSIICSVIALLITFLYIRAARFEMVDVRENKNVVRLLPIISTVLDNKGKKFDWELTKGKYVVIREWASWSPLYINELKDLESIKREFKDDVVVIAIHRMQGYTSAQKITDPLKLGAVVMLNDTQDAFYHAIGGSSMPETMFVNRSGLIIQQRKGSMDIDEFRERMRQLLEIPAKK